MDQDKPAVHMAFLRADGVIVRVNSGWEAFARLNRAAMPSSGVGANYLEWCADENQRKSVKALLSGQTQLVSFVYEATLRSKKRWFVVVGIPCMEENGMRAVMMHVDITAWAPRNAPMDSYSDIQGVHFPYLLSSLQQSLTVAVAEGIAAATRAPKPTPPDRTLTPRQTEVLNLIAAGKSNSEIAEILQCSLNTVKRHVSAVLLRLNLTSRAKAALYATEYPNFRAAQLKR